MNLFGRRPAPPLVSLEPSQLEGLLDLCGLDPVAAVPLAHQVLRWPSWARGDVVADDARRPAAAAWATGSLMPFGLAPRPDLDHPGAGRAAARALAEHAYRRLTSRGSVSGPAGDVAAVWEHLAASGMRSREERWEQPLLVAPRGVAGSLSGSLSRAVLERHPALEWVAAGLRPATPAEESLVLPASVHMFTAELGYDPTTAGSTYARHVGWLVASGRSYVLFDDGAGGRAGTDGPRAVAFKTDVGALWSYPGGAVAQLTGVWTRPDLRGRGIGSVALAAVVDAVRRDHVGPSGTVSLYVNSFNTAALALYRALGFTRAGTYATVLL
ncbi:GNAT family N-acetyltransferase [Actinomyces sp. MRS3W]|uniref:GNAT family N-acetyltransferase n=1 Tax=Actinomyces sp. MRS3W TaxID=2800796 RepID=UPI0028FD1E12|nr:GNAT family N-acetyltransferase [Actinomyces sp. MRS3W]MDU0348065.1 GNAT family N-acetyltransferase [Actinomyces sp. MRS3W]